MKPLCLSALVWLGAVAAAPLTALNAQPSTTAGAGVIDSFYLSLLKEGMQSYEDGRPAQAAAILRLACFGMLEAPQPLTGCLIRLGVAQALTEDQAAFTETFRRLAEVEERFKTYDEASRGVPTEFRAEFEKFLVRWIAEEQLASLPAFEPLSTRRIVAKLQKLPSDENRKELEKHIAAQPSVVAWRVALADLEQELGRLEPARQQINAALELDGNDASALCLQGVIEQRQGDCAAAAKALERCPALNQQPAVAEAWLSCLVKAGDGDKARAALAQVPKEWLADRPFDRLAKQIEKLPAVAAKSDPGTAPADPPDANPRDANPPGPATAPAPVPEVAETKTLGPLPTTATTTAAPPTAATTTPPTPTLPEELAKKAAQLRQQVGRVQYASELAAPGAAAEELANAHPDQPELQFLAAEIAYRSSRWQDAVGFFERGGDPGEARPVMLFYWAVSLFENGNRPGAEAVLQRALPKLNRTPLVEAYRAKILPAAATTQPNVP